MVAALVKMPARRHRQWPERESKMNEVTISNEWRSKRDISAHFGIGLRTVSDWMRRRILPFVKVGGVVRFCVPDCEAAVRKYVVTSRG